MTPVQRKALKCVMQEQIKEALRLGLEERAQEVQVATSRCTGTQEQF